MSSVLSAVRNQKYRHLASVFLVLLILLMLAACSGAAPAPAPGNVEPTAAEAGNTAVEAVPGSKFQESPMLAKRVQDKQLPPVDERLPAEPLVVPIRTDLGEEIGKYGGTLSAMGIQPNRDAFGAEWGGPTFWYPESVATWDLADRKFTPNIADSWTLADDLKSLTIHIRPGVRWSDGEPLTTEDVRFWWEDIMLNPQLTPQIPTYYMPGGITQTLAVDDQYTFRFEFAAPYVAAADRLSDLQPWAPKHYLQKWHIKYNPDADAAAQTDGFSHWWEAFLSHQDFREWDGDVPVLAPFIIGPAESTGTVIAERNPYYWKVDPEGKQLPYVDQYERVLVGSREILEAKAVAGEYNFGGAWADLQNYPLLAENADKAGYTLRLFPGQQWGGSISWAFNYTSKDPVLRQIFNDLRFRQAMAYAINREEFNQVFNLGLTEPRQAAPPPDWSFADPKWGRQYLDYAPDKANQLLDDMGLQWDANHEYRLRPDGQPLILHHDIGQEGSRPGEWELITSYWKAVGVGVEFKRVDQALYAERLLANDLDIGTWGAGGPSEAVSHAVFPIRLVPPWHWRDCCALAGIPWYDWWESRGARGEEPPAEIKQLYSILDEWQNQPMGSPKYLELSKQLVEINDKNVWWNVVTGPAPGVGPAICATAIAKEVKNIRNPEAGAGWWRVELLWLDR